MNRSKKITSYVISAVILSGVLFWGVTALSGSELESITTETKKVTLYKSPTCGCCVSHAAYLRRNGFEVEIVKTEDMDAIKEQYNIPSRSQSCHTTVTGDYVVEGHVPIEAIDKLLTEQPDIDGIALPDMPSGSPGMPGPQTEPFVVQALSDGQISTFTEL